MPEEDSVYLVVFCSAIGILYRRREGFTSTRTALFVALVALFIISTSHLCSTTSYFVLTIRALLINNPGDSVLAKNAAFIAKNHVLGEIGQVMLPIAVVIGDSIVLWRAWSLSGKNRMIKIFPILLQLALTAMAFSWIGCFVDEDLPTSISPRCRRLNTATYVLSMVTNFAATAMIGYMAWRHRQQIKSSLAPSPKRERLGRRLVLIFESGVVYMTLWACFGLPPPAVTQLTNAVYVPAFRQVFSTAVTQLVGMYPTVMVLLHYRRRSVWDASGRMLLQSDEDANFWNGIGAYSQNVVEARQTIITPLPYSLNPPLASTARKFQSQKQPLAQTQQQQQSSSSSSAAEPVIPTHIQAQFDIVMQRLRTLEADEERTAPPDYVSR
ncbi:hypothetical protein PQX77_017013 [Marasmius sp. AFHP31]|nr:hypothetical protein PQX77_017013 [Marasmius sp. AFHP31]